MQDPDAGRTRGVHWHGYAETRDGTELLESLSTLSQRLTRDPDTVLSTPEEVISWITAMTRHAHRTQVGLLSGRSRIGHVGDAHHTEHQELTGLEVLDRGDSLYTDIPRETDRMHLYAEAVTLEQCAQTRAVHQEQTAT